MKRSKFSPTQIADLLPAKHQMHFLVWPLQYLVKAQSSQPILIVSNLPIKMLSSCLLGFCGNIVPWQFLSNEAARKDSGDSGAYF